MADPARFHDALEAGDRRAAASFLVTEYAADVLSLCRALLRDEALAEDLTQEAFSRAIAALADFRADAAPKTWLKAIARNLCIDHLRRQRRRPDELGADECTDAGGAADDAPLPSELLARRDAVEKALASLDESARALVVLRFRHELGYAELADAFHQSQGAIRMRVSRAVAQMRMELSQPGPALFSAAVTASAVPAAGAPGQAARGPAAPAPQAPPPAPSRARRSVQKSDAVGVLGRLASGLVGLGAGSGAAATRARPPTPLSAFARLLAALSPTPSTDLLARLDSLAASA